MNSRRRRFLPMTGFSKLSAMAIVAVAMLSVLPCFAQSPEEVAKLTQALPANTRTVVDRLDELNELPLASWRFHSGDVPHGEATTLDDSSWQLVEPKSNAAKDAAWYRKEVEVPKTLHGYDLTGTRIWFQFHAYANGPMPQIIYFNGRRVAMGDDLEPIVLFDDAKPGDKILIAVKLLQTVDDKRFGGADARIDFAASRPNPEDLRKEFLSAAVLLPSLAPGSSTQIDTLTKAMESVDLKSLAAADQKTFDASLVSAQSQMETLRPLLQQTTLHLTGNSHIDAAWLWPWTETVDAVKRTFGTAAQLMNEYPSYTYTQSAAQYNQWMADKYPALNDQIKQRLAEGRWEIVGGMWIEPDLNMPDGESLVRQLLVGQATFKKLYGVTTRIGWNPDSFGYNWQLPQIYKRSGLDYFVTQKMTWNDTNQLPFKLFWWESPDGSKVLTYFPHDYANNNLNPVRLSADLATARERSPGMTEMMDLYGIGDHGGGPTRSVLDEGLHWMEPGKVVPKMEFGTAQPFFSKVEKQINPDSPTWNYVSIAKGDTKLPAPAAGQMSIPTWKDELYFEYHRGVMTTQADHKRNMRESEEWLLNAEKYSSLAWLDGRPYPAAELTDAWKQVLFNQFHDLAAGSGIGIIYKEAQRDYDRVRWTANETSHGALETLEAKVDTRTKAGVPVFVFNSLAWERSGEVAVDVELPSSAESLSVLDNHGKVLPSKVISHEPGTNRYHVMVQAGMVPSIGYKVLQVVPGTRSFDSDLKANGTTIENSALRVTVDPQTGCITSIFDKKANFETLAAGACGNELQAFKDTPKDYDAWNIDPGTLDQPPTLIHAVDSVKVVESGPMRASIQVARTWQSSKFVQEISLDAGGDEVKVTNDIDWHETHVLLKAAFPVAATSDNATYEIPYGTISRPTTRNNSWEKAKFEVPALRWGDLGNAQQGLSLINESKYGYDAVGNVLRLSLLRSPVWPDPDADREHHHFVYALYPHSGDWKQAFTERRGYELNYKLTAIQVPTHSGQMPAEHSFFGVHGDNVVLTAIKKTEDGNGLLFRFFEWAGKDGQVTLHVPDGATSATVTNLMETPEGSPLTVSGGDVTVPVTPYQIQTVRVDYPAQQSAGSGQ
ncbi:Alpha-mannosidase [Acidisarcina polymorpha]|uniref:Alpha-mannosidase n=1 Tax=Acidisarcina polymorpha TaxID=2211140 RepID=A0A2Z5FXS7_9BACT|nr:glycoside hydrolase family 38 C-terminal domain-containing protein [Acidisarcina polymorpha]AXC11693.1 Alpha-mannosidase [Acidisarcina polymorpha]